MLEQVQLAIVRMRNRDQVLVAFVLDARSRFRVKAIRAQEVEGDLGIVRNTLVSDFEYEDHVVSVGLVSPDANSDHVMLAFSVVGK